VKTKTAEYCCNLKLRETPAIVRISARVCIPQVESLEELRTRARAPRNFTVSTIGAYVLVYKFPEMDIIFGSSLGGTWGAIMRKKIIFIFLIKSVKDLSHAVV